MVPAPVMAEADATNRIHQRHRPRPAPRGMIAACTALCALLATTVLWPSRPLLVWNASPSSPKGLYLVVPRTRFARGDTVVAWPPLAGAEIAVSRGYLPGGVPLVKTVMASSGNRICGRGSRVEIGTGLVVMRLRSDRAGRALPWWHGCQVLGRGEVFLLGLADPASFDGRYFGPTDVAQIIGKARLLWPA